MLARSLSRGVRVQRVTGAVLIALWLSLMTAAAVSVPMSARAAETPTLDTPNVPQEVDEPSLGSELSAQFGDKEPEQHTQESIRDYIIAHAFNLYEEPKYSSKPSTSAPYELGALSQDTLEDALQALNCVRFVAGLDEVALDDSYNSAAQAAALVNAANGMLDHYPSKPAGMEQSLYDDGYAAASKSNLAFGYMSPASSVVVGYMNDSNSSNIARVGHRRWCLDDRMEEVGFGQAGTFTAMLAHDGTSRSPSLRTKHVAWPAAEMPTAFFGSDWAWSLSFLGYEFGADTVVDLERVADGRTWHFNAGVAGSDGECWVNTELFGGQSAVIFKPEGIESIDDGDKYEVTVHSDYSGNTYSYTVSFFELFEAESLALTCDESSIWNPVVKDGKVSVDYDPAIYWTLPVKAQLTNSAIDMDWAQLRMDSTADWSNLTVKSSKKAVVGIDSTSGDVIETTINGAGEAVITATYGAFEPATLTVRVNKADLKAFGSLSSTDEGDYNELSALHNWYCIVLYNGYTSLEEGRDYKIICVDSEGKEVDDAIDAGTYQVTYEGVGNYKGSLNRTITILPRNLATDSTVWFDQAPYTGKQIAPKANVNSPFGVLEEGIDYTVTTDGNIEVGDYTGTVTGMGNYTGSTSATFRIVPCDLGEFGSITAEDTTFTLAEPNPKVVVKANGNTLKEDKDYSIFVNNIGMVGETKAMACGIGNYTGSIDAYFNIVPADISKATVKLEYGTVEYSEGESYEPSVIVKLGGTELIENEDYYVLYEDNDVPGTAKVVVKGQLNYTGEAITSFKIVAPASGSGSDSGSGSGSGLGSGSGSGSGSSGSVSPGDNVTPSGGSSPSGASRPSSGSGSSASPSVVPSEPAIKGPSGVERLWGKTGLDTMAAIVARGDFPQGGTVVLATFDGYWDALTAAGIAGLADAPVLMTYSNELASQTSKLLKQLAPKTIVVCGGKVALSEKVEKAAADAAGGARTVRCSGAMATDTAVDIFEKAPSVTGGSWSDVAFVCTNDGYWDALAAAPIAYAANMPIFLTDGKSKVTDSTIEAMRKGGIKSVYLVGGEAAIDDNVRFQIEFAGFDIADRLWGATAVETSEKVAQFGVSLGMSADGMGLATTNGYWDALSGAALCGRTGSVMVLADGAKAHSISGFAKSSAGKAKGAYVFGGTAAVDDGTFKALKAALGL